MTMECRACPFCGREMCLDRHKQKAAHAKPLCEGFLKMVARHAPQLASEPERAAIEAAVDRYRRRPRGLLDRPKVHIVFMFMLGATLASAVFADWPLLVFDSGSCFAILVVDRWMSWRSAAGR